MQLIQAATGLLVERAKGGVAQLRGHCFAYRHPHTLITAAHCVHGLSQANIGFVIPTAERNDQGLDVTDIATHPTADVAVVRIAEDRLTVRQPFWNVATAAKWGDRFIAFGFPDVASTTESRPTPRMLQGFIQRFFQHESHLTNLDRQPYRYVAAELSVGTPASLSGGPVCLFEDQSMVLGVVTENISSSTFVEEVEEVDREGRTTRYVTKNMVNYGVAVALYDVIEWLEERVGP